jgi:hypothetical protein
MRLSLASLMCTCVLAGCASAPLKVTPPAAAWRDLAPGVQVDLTAKRVRIAAEICLDPKTAEPGRGVPLEAIIVTSMSGKEHEAIAVTKAKPSDVHAALLLIGLTPGKPGTWAFDKSTRQLSAHAPTGPSVHAQIHLPAGSRPLTDLVRVLDDSGHPTRDFIATAPHSPSTWLFAGSFFGTYKGTEVYDADFTGIVIGLCMFGGEVLAWPDVLDPEAARQQPIWYGAIDLVSPFGTSVTIEISIPQ